MGVFSKAVKITKPIIRVIGLLAISSGIMGGTISTAWSQTNSSKQSNSPSPFVGYWESNKSECNVTDSAQRSGDFVIIAPDHSVGPDSVGNQSVGNETAQKQTQSKLLMMIGSSDGEGATCRLKPFRDSGARKIYDALCEAEDDNLNPTRIELSTVYDLEHLAVHDQKTDTSLFYSLCSSNPNDWKREDKTVETEGQQQINPAIVHDFSWLPRRWCSKIYARQSDYVSSGECRQAISACMNGKNSESECPKFAQCEYWSNGKRRSKAPCGFVSKNNEAGSSLIWIWKNGNVVNASFDADKDSYRWSNREAEAFTEEQKSCLAIESTGEKFCSEVISFDIEVAQ